MEISLKVITSIIVGLVVIVVAGACLGVTLATAIGSINSVGEAWAQGMSKSITTSLRNYYDSWVDDMFSITAAVKASNLTMPSILISEGRANWTDWWVPFNLAFVSKKNYSSASYSIGFFDYFWTLNVRSEFDSNLQKVEWYENLQNDKTRMTGGGFLYHRENMTKAPFTAASNHYLEILMDDIDMALKVDATVMAALASKKAKNPTALTTCLWLPVIHMYVKNDPSRNFEQYCICFINDINHVAIGQAVVSLNSELELRSILLKSKKSPNAEHFILQRNAEIIATSRPEIFWTSKITTVTAAIPPHCYSSILPLPNVIPPRLGCLATTDTFPYPPLNAIGAAFAMTNTYTFDFFKVDGTIYAIASERMTSLADLSLNTITIIPEQDLYYGTINNSIAMSAGLTVAVAAVAIGVSLLLLHFIVRRLDHVQQLMQNLAELHDLDKDDDLGDEQVHVEGKNAASDGSSSSTTHDEENTVVDAFFKRKGLNKLQVDLEYNNNNNNNNNNNRNQEEAEQEKKDNSWIAEVANLETAYKQTVRSMTNFTRYVSRAVVKELILQRRRSEDLMQSPHSQQLTTTPAATGTERPDVPSAKHAALLEGISDPNVADEYDVTVLIADIEGFSSQIWQTNRSNYDGVLYILHIYFKRVCRLIMGHGGVVDKFMGDSVMSYWGAPVRTEHHALLAALSALSLLRETRRNPLKRIFERTLQHDVKIRCGLASGAAIVGTFGNVESVNYSVIGAPVTQARYFQDFNKYWSTNILMDGNCMRKVDDTIVNRLICQAMFQPTGKPEYVYEVMGLNLDSRLARAKVSSDILTIAFTDVLSLPTMHADNQGVQEILRATAPEHESTIDALLNWHAKCRSALPASFVVYAEQFSEAARSVIEQRFSDAVTKFTAIKEFRSSSSSSMSRSDSGSCPTNTGENHSPLTLRSSSSDSESSSVLKKNPPSALNTSNSGNSDDNATPVPTNPRGDSSSNNSASSGTELIFNLSNDQCLQNLLTIATIYVRKTPPRNTVDAETNTFFVRAFKLDAIERQGRSEGKKNNDDANNNNNNNHSNNNNRKEDDDNNERPRRSKSKDKKEKTNRSRSGSRSEPSASSNNIIDTIPHQTQQ